MIGFWLGLIFFLTPAGTPAQAQALAAADSEEACVVQVIKILEAHKDEVATQLAKGLTPRAVCTFIPGDKPPGLPT